MNQITVPTQYLTNATLVLSDGTYKQASLVIADGVIQSICPDTAPIGSKEIDLQGRILMPGLIDLHCDALEKEVEPRPNVHFPLDFACTQSDRRNAMAGITTVYHALSFANHELGVRNNHFAAEIVKTVNKRKIHTLVDNRVHVRYEVTDITAPPILSQLLSSHDAHMISFMDHSPGQGQFKSEDALRTFLGHTYNTSHADIDRILEEKRIASLDADARIKSLAQLAQAQGIAIASHDDDTPEKIGAIAQLGATISEFPINLETAKAARERGLATMFGAPNILRGKSQSGSMRALDAVNEGVADCLCGDYSPTALLVATLRLVEITDLTLHQATALVTSNPARAAGLVDRGEIAVGKRADLIAVSTRGGIPQADFVWSQGRLAFTCSI